MLAGKMKRIVMKKWKTEIKMTLFNQVLYALQKCSGDIVF